MRLIDADKLRGLAIPCEFRLGALTDLGVPLYQIDNAPTVEITEEQAIDKLHETGWLPLHDKEMTERPHGEWETPFEMNGKTYHKGYLTALNDAGIISDVAFRCLYLYYTSFMNEEVRA